MLRVYLAKVQKKNRKTRHFLKTGVEVKLTETFTTYTVFHGPHFLEIWPLDPAIKKHVLRKVDKNIFKKW